MSKLTELSSRPATITATTRLDARHLATLAHYWASQGEHCRSTSELIRLSLESFSSVLVTSQITEFIDSQSRAMEVLKLCGLGGIKVQKGTMQKALLLEQGIDLTSLTSTKDISARSQQTGKVAEPTLDLATAALEKRMSDEQKKNLASRIASSKESTTEALEGLGQTPEGEER